MIDLTQLPILVAIFILMMTLVGMVPALVRAYREKTRVNLHQTTRELNRFFVDIKPIQIIAGAGILGALLGVATGSWVLAAALCVGSVFAPRFVLAIWKDKRSHAFEAQLMDALILLGNALRSGLDIAAGIELISTNMKGVIAEEFGLVLNAYRLGTPLEEAMLAMTGRISSRTLETVIYAIIIQRNTGGNIVKTFEQLIVTIREEGKLQKKVKAITSQGRTQIVFLAVFPWALAALFFVMAPEFMRPALQHPLGQIVMVGLIVWEIIGIVVTKKIVTVDV